VSSHPPRHKNGLGVPKQCSAAAQYYKEAARQVVEQWRGSPTPTRKALHFFLDDQVGHGSKGGAEDAVLQYYYQDQHRTQQGGAKDGKLEAYIGNTHYQGTANLPQDFPAATRFFQVRDPPLPGERPPSSRSETRGTRSCTARLLPGSCQWAEDCASASRSLPKTRPLTLTLTLTLWLDSLPIATLTQPPPPCPSPVGSAGGA
jgi:hypothetical protein